MAPRSYHHLVIVTDGQAVALAALGVASPKPDQTSPANLANYVREQWSIESPHWIRDTLYQEDKSQIKTRSGPRVMAALRNLAIGALRLAGRTDITEATRGAAPRMDRRLHHPRTHTMILRRPWLLHRAPVDYRARR